MTYVHLSCNECFIGSTSRQLNCRIAENMDLSARTNLSLLKPPFSFIREHHQNTEHTMDKKITIPSAHNNNISLRLLRVPLYLQNKPDLNSSSPIDLNNV